MSPLEPCMGTARAAEARAMNAARVMKDFMVMMMLLLSSCQCLEHKCDGLSRVTSSLNTKK